MHIFKALYEKYERKVEIDREQTSKIEYKYELMKLTKENFTHFNI